MNESKRQQKYAKLIQKDLSEIIQKDKMNIFTGEFVTIAAVSVSPDLSLARVFLSMFTDKKEEMLEKVRDRKSEIRKALGNRIGKQVRIVPDLEFHLDELEENAARIDKIISELNIPPAEDEED